MVNIIVKANITPFSENQCIQALKGWYIFCTVKLMNVYMNVQCHYNRINQSINQTNDQLYSCEVTVNVYCIHHKVKKVIFVATNLLKI